MAATGEALEFVPDDGALAADIPREGLTHVVAQSPALPLLQLEPRHFETLAYLVLKELAPTSGYYDQVSILPMGADSGRDLLLRRGAVTGIVQCKRMAARMGREEILVEILRLALYAVRNSALLPAAGTRYELWTASGVSGRALELFDAEDFRAIARGEMPALAERARRGIASLSRHTTDDLDAAEVAQAVEIAGGLTPGHVGPEDIASYLARLPSVRRQFFRSPEDGPPIASIKEMDKLVDRLRQDQLEMRLAARRLRGDHYVPRLKLDEAFGEFLQDPARVFLLIGGSGQGKTSWASRMLLPGFDERTTLVIPADEIARSDRNAVDTIGRLLTARPASGVPLEQIDQAVWSWLDGGNRLLAVDGLDRALSDVRESLPAWIDTAIGLTRKAPVKLVLTTRAEAFSATLQGSSALKAALFRPEERTASAGSIELNALTPDEAEHVYAAYGVSPFQHRGAPLTTPSLIAAFSRMKENTGLVVTRLDILRNEFATIELELKAAQFGAIAISRTMSWIGDSLLSSSDGWFPVGDDPTIMPVLEEMTRTDWMVQRDGQLRMNADDLAELLLAKRLTPAAMARHLDDERGDPIFIGASALAIAALEDAGGADEALGMLLDGAPSNFSGRLDAVARAILELREPIKVRQRIKQAIGLWNHDNFMLVASGLGTLLIELDLPGRDLFDLIMPLAGGEDADDWRGKYWSGSQDGRWVTGFAVAAERAALSAPVDLLPDLLSLSRSPDPVRSSIGLMLLYRAATVAPVPVLEGTWGGTSQSLTAFEIAQHAAPAAAATFLAGVNLPDAEWARVVVERLEISAGKRDRDDYRSDVIKDAADRLLGRIERPKLRARLLVLRLEASQSAELRSELGQLWSHVSDARYWDALAVMGDESGAHLAALLSGSEPARDLAAVLGALPLARLQIMDPAPLIGPLRNLVRQSPGLARAVSGAVEAMLYAHAAPAMPELEELALELAANPEDDVRAQLIYYAGSIIHHDPTPEEAERRERLLTALVANETGGNLGVMVWKLIESAPERPEPQRHLDVLARRVGRKRIDEAMKFYRFLPAWKQLVHQLRDQ